MNVVHIPTRMNFTQISTECDNGEIILENEYGVRNSVTRETFKRFFSTPQGLILYENQQKIKKDKQIESKIKRDEAKRRKEKRDWELNRNLREEEDLSDRVAEYVCMYHENVNNYGCFDPEDEIRRINSKELSRERFLRLAKGE